MSAARVAVIALDGFSPIYMDRFVREGRLPAIGAIAKGGVSVALRSTLPATTPVAWAAAVTGCSPAVNGIDGNLLHVPGDRLDRRLGCYAHRCRAEPLWETATLNARRSCVVKFPVSYPSETATFRLDGAAGWAGLRCLHELSSAATASTDAAGNGTLIQRHSAWRSEEAARDVVIWRGDWTFDTLWGVPRVTLHVAVSRGVSESLMVSVADAPDWDRVLDHVGPGAWSTMLAIRARGRCGDADFCFRIKVLECVGQPFRLRLYHSVLHERTGHSAPDTVWSGYVDQVGPIEEQTDPSLFFAGEIDLATQIEIFALNAAWIKRVSTALLTRERWDLFMVHVHFLDWAHHMLHGALDPRHPQFRESTARQYERVLLECYRMADDIVGEIRAALSTDTNVVVLGDHGQDVHHTTLHTNEWLDAIGLLRWNGAGEEVDWSRTKAYAAGNYVFLNLQGREPTGIVPPREADGLIEQITTGLLALRDPARPDQAPIAKAGTQSEFAEWGTSGPGVGDVVALCSPGYQLRNNRGPLFAPTRLFEEFTSGHDHFSPGDPQLETRLFAAGPQFQRRYRHPALERLIDVAPTLCAALDMQPPPECEGNAISALLRPQRQSPLCHAIPASP